MLFLNEIIKSIENVFESDFSTQMISDETRIPYTSISELRNKKRDLLNTNVKNCYKLYEFSVEHKLNQEFLNNEMKKGRYEYIPLNLQIKKIIVVFNRLDLFQMGIMVPQGSDYKTKKDELVPLVLSNSVFVTRNNEIYDTYEFHQQFQCNYGGGGPNDLARFIKRYSKIKPDEIENVIFNNEIVIYDFENDKIEGGSIDKNFDGIELNSYNSKLIITIDKEKEDYKENYKYDLEYYINKIKVITGILDKHYNKDIRIKRISYIYDYKNDATQKYQCVSYLNNTTNYKIIIAFDNFEIWIPYFINNKNAFYSNEMKEFINKLGIEHKNPNFIESILLKLNNTDKCMDFIDI